MIEICAIVIAASCVVMTMEKVAWFSITMYWNLQSFRQQKKEKAEWAAGAAKREEEKAKSERDHAVFHEKTAEFQGEFLRLMKALIKKESEGDDWKGENEG